MLSVRPVLTTDPGVAEMVQALTDELSLGGYADDESFGYSLEQLAGSGVHLVGAFDDDALVGIGGVEVDDSGDTGELKRFYVSPGHRGREVAAALLEALVAYAEQRGVEALRLETGDQQQAAMSFYRRHGFIEVPRFGPYVDSATSVCFERTLGPC